MGGCAVFLDRDGVLNRLIFNPSTGEFESPHLLNDLQMLENIEAPLKSLQAAGYSLFLVSNQPSYAKGKTSLASTHAIHAALDEKLKKAGILFREYYYCYHHPDGIVPGLSGPCQCRKPKPYFINKALSDYEIERIGSWMIGDQDSDIECGQAAGLKTIMIESPESAKKRGKSKPEHRVRNLEEAVRLILTA